MSFIWPPMLVSLLLVPLGAALYVRRLRRQRALRARYGSLGLVQAAGRPPGARRHVPPALFLAGLAILLVALARPQAAVALPRVEGTVILAFDISGSMAAEDLRPTRMEAAKSVAREFVQRQPPTVQIGVVAFSDGGLPVQAPTSDRQAILGAIDRIAPQRGTSLGQGILASLAAITARRDPAATPQGAEAPEQGLEAQRTPASIVLLSDGENTAPPNPLAAAQTAADRGVRIYTIGVGSAEGTTLEVNGFTVHTRLDEATLRQIAQITAGAYYRAGDEQELRAIYENLELQLVVEPEMMEVTGLFASAAILLLLAGAACSLLWFGRAP
ncbi:MAG TPA: VWA domain-containing protein [Roseiflexaceae bacterium]|nr:VWA domain-containing protein [Roseiflexaceae bacterium]